MRADEHDVEFVHYCVYCSWNREASSLTMLSPRCERCGCALRADGREAFKRIAPSLRETVAPIRRRTDTTTVFGCLVSLPFLLPLFGVHISDIAFAVPLVMLLFATVRCAQASTLSARRRGMWRALTAACASAAAASALALVSAVTGGTLTAAFYLGALGSIGLLVAGALLAWRTLRGARLERVVDALLWCAVIAALGTYFVVIPGFAGDDAVLTSVFLIDLAAVVMFALAVIVGLEPRHRRMGWWLVGAVASAAVGDGLVAMDGAGWLPTLSGFTALLWAAAGFGAATAAEQETADADASEPAEEPTGARWLVGRVLLPLTAVVFFPALGLSIWLDEGRLDPWQVAFFGAFFVLALVVAFGRQAYLLLDNRRAVTRERRLRREVMSRNAELEALTGLATTMTQTLEEAPIIEQALGVLHLAARASSSALHGIGPNGHELLATTGDWQDDEPWVGVPPEDAQPVEIGTRGRRSIARFQLSARGHTIGTVSLVRPSCDALTDEGVRLLRLLVDEMAVAVQNARLPRKARAGDPRPAHRPVQPAFLLRGTGQGDRPPRALRLLRLARDVRRGRLQADQRPPWPRDRRRRAAQDRAHRAEPAAAQRLVRPYRRRGVRAASARDPAARRPPGRRARAHGDRAQHHARRPPRDALGRGVLLPPGRDRPRGPREEGRCRAVLGQAQRQGPLRRGQRGHSPRRHPPPRPTG